MATNSSVQFSIQNLSPTSNSSLTLPAFSSQIGWFFAVMFVCVVCVSASLCLLLAVIKDHTSSLSTRILITNICVIGIIFCSVFVPATSIVGFFPSLWKYESARNSACPLYMGLEICYTSFSFTDAFLASNRLVAVCLPHRYDTWQSPKISYVMVAASWLISIILIVLNVLEIGGSFVRLSDFTCQAEPTSSFGLVLFAISGTGPYFLIGIFSLIIFTTAHIKARRMKAQMASSSSVRHQLQTLQRKLGIAKAMAILLIWSIITQVPFTVVPMYLSRMEEDHYDLWRFLRIFPLTQYSLSPLVLLALSSSYRKALRRVCGCAERSSVKPEG